ncbi:MAG: GNAT family N-acetyltransferase [Dehalococcoidia bacterium]|nr:GNAT family N-acetyltransferase [Dehalococcoidia bacterium]
MSIVVRTISDDEFDSAVRASVLGFGDHASDELLRVARSDADVGRTFGAFDGRDIVGTTVTRTSAMTIPGGTAKLGFVDDVAVLPTHRRRGILTQMMRAQLDQMRESDEPLSALSASESLIYERFGFGIATWYHRWKIDRRHTAMKVPPNGGGRVRFISADTAREVWPKLHAKVRDTRVGMVHYSEKSWRAALWDAEFQRDGATEFFHVAYIRGDRIVGLCTYRRRERTILVFFLLGEDAEVEAELWRYCFGIDLTLEIQTWPRPTDDPLPWRLDDPRRLERSLIDHMWLRLVDVKVARVSRSYAEAGGLTLRVHDEFCTWNDGVYLLEAGVDGAECTRSQGEPQVELGVSDLGAAYLGGVSFSNLARAGRVKEHAPGALASADRMFRTERQPWSMEL